VPPSLSINVYQVFVALGIGIAISIGLMILASALIRFFVNGWAEAMKRIPPQQLLDDINEALRALVPLSELVRTHEGKLNDFGVRLTSDHDLLTKLRVEHDLLRGGGVCSTDRRALSIKEEMEGR
jgi:hypothetical protein